MFFFPLRINRKLRRIPWVNLGLIAVNVLIFAYTYHHPESVVLREGMLNPLTPKVGQFLTYQFLHAGLMHLVGNMLFLYVFGNNVEDRLGRLGYLLFYLAGGVAAGLGHCLVDDAPVLGASGSVAAVTGAFLVLFPFTHVLIGYWVIVVGYFEVSSLIVILFQIAENVLLQVFSKGQVAHMAHLSGYAFGFVIAMGLLAARILGREDCDLLWVMDHQRRRARFRALTRSGYQPWETNRPKDPPPAGPPSVLSAQAQQVMQSRAAVLEKLGAGDLAGAAEAYLQLLELDGSQVMARGAQLDLSNQLMAQGSYAAAAQGYERFLQAYPQDGGRAEVQLLLGVLYVRYLQRRQRGREVLAAARRGLVDRTQRELAERMLEELGPA